MPRGDLDVDEVGGVARGAERGLGERAEVRVVVDGDREVEAHAHLVRGGDADPAGEDRGGADDARGLLDRARQAHAGADHLRALDARVVERLGDELGGRVQAVARRVVGVELEAALGEDVRGEIGDRDAQVAVAEVDADGRARRGVEGEQDRRPAALIAVRGGGLAALDDEAVSLEIGDQRGHGGAAQPGPPGDLGARDQPLGPQRVDDAQAVQAAKRFERPDPCLRHGRIRSDRPIVCQGLVRTSG